MPPNDNMYEDIDPMPLRGDELPLSHGLRRKLEAFELEGDDDDELLADWAASQRRAWTVCGLDCTWMRRLLRGTTAGPEWWRRMSPAQRGLLLAALVACIVGVVVLAVAPRGTSKAAGSDSASGGGGGPAGPYTPRPMNRTDAPLCDWQRLYLPDTVRPAAYHLNISTAMSAPDYRVTGAIVIQLAVDEDTPCLVLHAMGMDIKEVVLQVGEGPGAHSATGTVVSTSEDRQQVVLGFDEALPRAPWQPRLVVGFEYGLQEGLDGFYLSRFLLDDDSEHVMGSTQFESIAARKAFPCFDEPAYKAPFELFLEVPRNLTALSNMPLDRDMPGSAPGLVCHCYKPSPPMPTYLVAWVVGELEHVGSSCKTAAGQTPVAVWATEDRKGQLGTALRVACSALQTYERLLGVPYALPKLDLVGVPNFAAGAMENWGLLTYRETALLVDESANDIQQEYYIATVVSHEIAHQWFGDLVTLDDWTSLWLNEGFATLFENIAADVYKPSAHYFDTFYGSFTAVGLEADGANTSHPLTIARPIESLDEIDNWFDAISYEKGGAVLRMLRAYLNRDDERVATLKSDQGMRRRAALRRQRRLQQQGGKPGAGGRDPFLAGLTEYLQGSQFGSGSYQKLWGAMGNVTGLDVSDMMNVWTLRHGYPIVTAQHREDSQGNQIIMVDQIPFHPARSFDSGLPFGADEFCNDYTGDPEESSWWIPLAYVTGHGSDARPRRLQWMPFSNCTQALPQSAGNAAWLLVNAGRYGYYRANYSEPLWAALSQAAANPADVPPADLAGTLDDAYALALARQLRVSIFLELTRPLGQRLAVEYSPWAMALRRLRGMRDVLGTAALTDPKWAPCAAALSNFAVSNITGPYIKGLKLPGHPRPGLGFDVDVSSDSEELRLLRPLVLMAAGELGDQQVQQEATALLMAGKALQADVRAAVYRLAVKSGDADAYAKIVSLYKDAHDAVEKAQLLSALQHAPSLELIQKTLQFALSPDVRLQDVGGVISGVARSSPAAFQAAWDFIFADVAQIIARFPGGDATYSFGRRLAPLARLFTDEAMIPRLEALAGAHPGVLPPTFLDTVRYAVRVNGEWLVAQGEDACAWLGAPVAEDG